MMQGAVVTIFDADKGGVAIGACFENSPAAGIANKNYQSHLAKQFAIKDFFKKYCGEIVYSNISYPEQIFNDIQSNSKNRLKLETHYIGYNDDN